MSIESNPKPLEIRGHHLINFIHLFACLNSDYKPRRSLEEFRVSGRVEQAIEEAIDKVVVALNAIDERTSEILPPNYKEDVMGTTPEDEAHFRNNRRAIYFNFLTLPDDYPVRVLVNELDDICRICTVGKHCEETLNGHSDELAMNGYFGWSTQPGEILPLKTIRWVLSIVAYHGLY